MSGSYGEEKRDDQENPSRNPSQNPSQKERRPMFFGFHLSFHSPSLPPSPSAISASFFVFSFSPASGPFPLGGLPRLYVSYRVCNFVADWHCIDVKWGCVFCFLFSRFPPAVQEATTQVSQEEDRGDFTNLGVPISTWQGHTECHFLQ